MAAGEGVDEEAPCRTVLPVHQVRVWDSDQVDAFQFVYKEHGSNDIIEGKVKGKPPKTFSRSDSLHYHEFKLIPNENVCEIAGREANCTIMLEWRTTFGRAFRFGTNEVVGQEFATRAEQEYEIYDIDSAADHLVKDITLLQRPTDCEDAREHAHALEEMVKIHPVFRVQTVNMWKDHSSGRLIALQFIYVHKRDSHEFFRGSIHGDRRCIARSADTVYELEASEYLEYAMLRYDYNCGISEVKFRTNKDNTFACGNDDATKLMFVAHNLGKTEIRGLSREPDQADCGIGFGTLEFCSMRRSRALPSVKYQQLAEAVTSQQLSRNDLEAKYLGENFTEINVSSNGTWKEITEELYTKGLPRLSFLELLLEKKQVECANTGRNTKECVNIAERLRGVLRVLQAIEERGLTSIGIPLIQFVKFLKGFKALIDDCSSFYRIVPFVPDSNLLDDVLNELDLLEKLTNAWWRVEAQWLRCAVMEKNVSAIESLTKRVLEFDELDVAVDLFVKGASVAPMVVLRDRLLRLAVEDDNADLLRELFEVISEPREAVLSRFHDGETLLHVATRGGCVLVAQWLVFEGGMNPRVKSENGQRALHMVEYVEDEGKKEQLSFLLSNVYHRRKFEKSTTKLITMDSATITRSDIEKLVPYVTSVYDLRVIFTMASAYLSRSDIKKLLVTSFQHVMERKLVFDHHEAAYFKMILNECRRRELLTEVEYIEWDMENTRVNAENSPWVRDIKRSVQKLGFRIDGIQSQVNALRTNVEKLRTALLQQQEALEQQKEREQMLTMITMGLGFVAGPVVKHLLANCVDLSNPMTVLLSLVDMTQDDLIEAIAENSTEFVLEQGVDMALRECDLDPQDFVRVLSGMVVMEDDAEGQTSTKRALQAKIERSKTEDEDAILNHTNGQILPDHGQLKVLNANRIENGEYMQVDDIQLHDNAKRSANKPEQPEGRGALRGNKRHVSLRSVFMLHKRRILELSEPEAENRTLPWVDKQELEQSPFHSAVYDSDGNLENFRNFVGFIADLESVNETIEVIVGSEAGSEENGNQRPRLLPAHVYASYLGYEEIVDFMINQYKPRQEPEAHDQTRMRAHKVAYMREHPSV